MQVAREKGGIAPKRVEKNFKEFLKKVLTSEKRCDIIVKLSARSGGEKWSLKIEQQREKYKAYNKTSANVKISSKSYIYSTK